MSRFLIYIMCNGLSKLQIELRIAETMQQSLYYQFEINIHRIYVDINFPCNLQVKWRKGKHQSSGKFFKIADSIHFIDINDFIGIKVRCKYIDNRFLPQQTKVQVLLFPLQSNEIKVAGQIQKFDLTQMLLVDRRRENTQKKFELPLSKSTPNSRIVFTIYAKYLMDGQNQQSLADVSFQAQNNSTFNQSSTDMTFRPPSDNRRTSRQKEELESRSPLMPPKAETRLENREERIYSRESRHENGRQNKDQNRYDNKKIETRNQQRYSYDQKNEHPFSKVDMPLGFSFGPQMAPQDKDRQMKQLLDNFNEINRELIEKKKECERLQVALRQAQRERGGIDQKKLQLINELNSAVTQVDSLKKQKTDLSGQISKYKEDIRELQASLARIKDQNKDLITNFNRLRQQTSQQMREMSEKLQRKHKEVQDNRLRLDKILRENQQLKKDIFKKQSELITSQNQAQEVKAQYLNKSVPIIEQLKKTNQDLGRQRAELERALNQTNNQLQKQKSLRDEYEKKARTSAEELGKEKEKIKSLIVAFEAKEKQNKDSLNAIEQEMQHFFGEKDQELRGKDRTIQELNRKLAQQSKKRQEESKKREQESKRNELISRDCQGNQILISELRVKIKHLEDACDNLEKDLADKEKECNQKGEFIDRVRQYVTKIERDVQEKEAAIKQRDEFITKAKEFITTREKQLLTEIDKIKRQTVGAGAEEVQKLKAEITSMISQGKKREEFVAELVEEGNGLQQKLEEAESDRQLAQRRAGELQQYAGHMQQRLQILQQQMQELVRKTRSQQQTLSELVKNKLQMQIQLNLCNFELQNLRKRS